MGQRKSVKEVLASIDQDMETAITAGVVDHETQASSWISEEVAAGVQLEQVVQQLEALEELPAAEDIAGAEIIRTSTLGELLQLQNDQAVEATVVEIAGQIDDRSGFEAHTASMEGKDDANIQRTLKKVRTQMVTKRAARLLLAVNVTPGFINRQVHTGSAYNVYALGKLGDLIYGVTDGVVANAINQACMRSLFAFKAAGVPFTMECAKASASKQYAKKIDAAVRKHLVSHTVSTTTAPTQASSTMQALCTLGVCKTNGVGKNPTYTVQDTPLAHKLEAMMSLAA